MVKKKSREYTAKMNEPYNAEIRSLHDACEDLGYDDWLNEDGITSLESRAWEQGHANGFSEVYYHLQDLTDMKDKFK